MGQKLKSKRKAKDFDDDLFPPYKIAAWQEYRRLELTPEQARLSFGDEMVEFFIFMQWVDEIGLRMAEVFSQSGLSIDEISESLASLGRYDSTQTMDG